MSSVYTHRSFSLWTHPRTNTCHVPTCTKTIKRSHYTQVTGVRACVTFLSHCLSLRAHGQNARAVSRHAHVHTRIPLSKGKPFRSPKTVGFVRERSRSWFPSRPRLYSVSFASSKQNSAFPVHHLLLFLPAPSPPSPEPALATHGSAGPQSLATARGSAALSTPAAVGLDGRPGCPALGSNYGRCRLTGSRPPASPSRV